MTARTDPPLLGRDDVLELVRDLEVATGHGRPSVATLVGEAGIGKTATARTISDDALARGACVLWGACHDEEPARPYAPWAQALRGLGDVAATLGADAAVLGALAPGFGTGAGDLPSLPPGEERFRLQDAVGRLFARLGRPVLLVLEDLHWADAPSLELLLGVVRSAPDARILVLGTHRDVELALDDPLTHCLAELRRDGALHVVRLRPLSEADSALLLERIAGRPVPPEVEAAVFRRAAGNPFFTEELGRSLDEVGEEGIPDSVRHAVGRRVSRLSPDAVRLLGIAAAFAGDFDARVLQALSELDEETLLDTLDEALAARLVRHTGDEGERYRFAHELVREALAGDLNPSRRARLHRRVAQAVEAAGPRGENTAAELALQYHRSMSLPGAAHGIDYALAAAAQATTRHAQIEAVSFLRIARDLARGEAEERLADILPPLAVAEAEALLLHDAAASAAEAHAVLVEAGASASRLAELAWSVARPLRDGGAPESVYGPLVDRALELVGRDDGLIWARPSLVRMPTEPLAGTPLAVDRWIGYDAEAVRIARFSGDESDYANTIELLDWRSLEELEELLALCRTWRSPQSRIHVLSVVARSYLYYHARLHEAEAVSRELLDLSEEVGSLPGRAYGAYGIGDARIALGDFEVGEPALVEARRLVTRLGPAHRLHLVVGLAEHRLGHYRDEDWGGQATYWERVATDPATPWRWITLLAAGEAALAHAWTGDAEAARRLALELVPVLESSAPRTLNQNDCVALAAATAWRLADAELAARVEPLARALIEAGVGDHAFDSSLLAAARCSALLGRHEDALERFSAAREALARDGRRPLAAIAAFDEALAATHAGAAAPRGELAAALTSFEALRMPSWAARARALLDETAATVPAGLSPREVEILTLLAGGRTNREIADELVLSVHTVERHLANAYRKIGARNRAEATAFALRHGL